METNDCWFFESLST